MPEAAGRGARLGPMRVLIATQADATGGALTRVLAMVDPHEFDIRYSGSLEESFVAIADGDFDAMVLSLQMPEGEGPEAIERVTPVLGHIPAIAVLEEYDASLLALALESGIQRVLTQQSLNEDSFRDALLHAQHLHRLWSELRASRTREARLAHHDPLTGAYNRRWLDESLPQMLTQSRFREESTGLLFLDLDGFKGLNDSLGHEAGDALLRKVAERLDERTRRTDAVVRLGGDEFVIVLNRTSLKGAEIAAREALNALAEPIEIEGRPERITTSIGVAVAPQDGEVAKELLHNADAAMYRAKALGKNRAVRFTAELAVDRGHGYGITRDLYAAIEGDGIDIFVQPQVDVQAARVTGVEALARWPHPERGLLSPAEFIPTAERAGLMPALGDLVLDRACATLARWCRRGANLRMSVNVSAQQLVDPTIVRTVASHLERHAIPPSLLEIEITETSILAGSGEVQRTLSALSDLGVRLALDDFGTGYSSLSVFWQIPLHRVKIDQSFVRSARTDETAQAIVLSVLHLAATRNIEVIAEGVEEEEQAEMLQDFGCNAMQGYLFGRPMPISDFEAFTASPKAPWREPLEQGSWRQNRDGERA